jgi:hypothetical protein
MYEREFCAMSHQQSMRTDVHSLFHECSATRIYRVDGLRAENAPSTSVIHWANKIRSDLRHHGEKREWRSRLTIMLWLKQLWRRFMEDARDKVDNELDLFALSRSRIMHADHSANFGHFVYRTQSMKGRQTSTRNNEANKTHRLAAGLHYIECLDAGGEPHMQERGVRGQCIYAAAPL